MAMTQVAATHNTASKWRKVIYEGIHVKKVFLWRLKCLFMSLGKQENTSFFFGRNDSLLYISVFQEKDTSRCWTSPVLLAGFAQDLQRWGQDLPQKLQLVAECKTLNSAFFSCSLGKSSRIFDSHLGLARIAEEHAYVYILQKET